MKIKKLQQGNILKQDNTKVYSPETPRIFKSPPLWVTKTPDRLESLNGQPTDNITYEERWERQKREGTLRDAKNVLRGLNNTFGRAASLAGFLYGGGWAATRLLNRNKASTLGQALSKYVLPTNTIDAIGDVSQVIEDPSLSNASEVGVSLGLGRWKDFGKVGRQVSELGSQGLNLYNSFKIGGKFTPKKSRLIKNAESQNSKRDMRKKFIKSDRPTYTKPTVKKQQGGTLDYKVEEIPINPDIFTSWNSIKTTPIEIPDITPNSRIDSFMDMVTTNPIAKPKDNTTKVEEKKVEIIPYKQTSGTTYNITPSKGLDAFNKIYDELEKEMPEAKDYRQFLTSVANYESGFNSSIKNQNAPAYGYFQFMQDDKKYNNIKHFAGVDTKTFLSDPKIQIRAAIALAKANEKSFSQEDLEAAKNKGISKWGMLGGAWLGGVGGLRKYLLHNKNISDKHWSPTGAGIDMENQIKRYNF